MGDYTQFNATKPDSAEDACLCRATGVSLGAVKRISELSYKATQFAMNKDTAYAWSDYVQREIFIMEMSNITNICRGMREGLVGELGWDELRSANTKAMLTMSNCKKAPRLWEACYEIGDLLPD